MTEGLAKAPVSLEDVVRDVTDGFFGAVMKLLDVAEQEIAIGKKRFPRHAKSIDSNFMAYRPTEVLQGKTERVYRSHVRELITRVVRRNDLRPGTAAEILCGMLGAATIAPLNSEGAALTERLFQIVMRQEIGGERFRPTWKGQVEEAYAFAKKKTRQSWRKAS